MTVALFNIGSREEQWARMMGLSFLFHFLLFFAAFFLPRNSIHYSSFEEKAYYVELVASPERLKKGGAGPIVSRNGEKSKEVVKKRSQKTDEKAQRITVEKKKKTLPVVAQRVTSKRINSAKEKDLSASELIEEALKKVEKRIAEKKKDQEKKIGSEKPEAPNSLLSGSEEGEEMASGGRLTGVGKFIQLYQLEIETTIKNNWSYPVALVSLEKGQIPEASLVLTVQSDGKILKSDFKKRSGNSLFDESVMKAIEKSDPLPEFPPGYRKQYEEIEISFSLKDLF